jgi:hypothetical protein
MFFCLLEVFWELTEETFQDNLKVGMDFQSRVCAKFGAFFIVGDKSLIIENMSYFTIYQ